MEASTDSEQERLAKEDELFRKSAVTFAKENKDTSSKINDALKSGDIKTAHRIAHTLKSSAGFLGKVDLQEAAFSLEQSLHGEPPEYTSDQLMVIKRELDKALHDFEPLLKEAELSKPDAVQISAEERAALFADIRPLLENADFDASDYVKKLQGIEGMAELAERIDDYDFEGALKALEALSDS
jgi:HPt (histidine-containing phosphotransfer) domain-containing protein